MKRKLDSRARLGFSSFLPVIIASLFPGFVSAAETCSFVSTVKPVCDQIRQAEKDSVEIRIGNSRLPSKAQLETQVADFEARPKKQTTEEREKFSNAFSKAKIYSEKVLLAGRSESELSAAEKNLLSRLRTMKFSNLESEHEQSLCKSEGYLGWAPQTNTLVLCPIMSGYSEPALIRATAMFIGVGLGSCMTSLPKSETKQEPLTESEHPWSSIRQCLISGSDGRIVGPGAPNFGTPEAKETLETVAKTAKMKPAALESAIKAQIATYPTCFPAFTGDQASMATGEWFGGEVIGKYLEDHPEAADSNPLGSLAWFVDDACRYHSRKDISKLYGHATHEARFNDIVLRSETQRKLLGCARDPALAVDCRNPASEGRSPLKSSEPKSNPVVN